jgi:hypothetical protein
MTDPTCDDAPFDDALVEAVARAILARVPFGYGMTVAEAADYARAALAVAVPVVMERCAVIAEKWARPAGFAISDLDSAVHGTALDIASAIRAQGD